MSSFIQFFATPEVDEWGDTTWNLTMGGYTAIVIIIIALLLLASALFGGKQKFSVRQVAFSAMAIALATILSNLKVIQMPMGGSVTLLSMLFVALIGYWYGPAVGIMAAIAYGLLQMIIDPYILSLPQMLVDYPLAFGALGLSGFFSKSKNGLIKGYILGVLGRYAFAVLSGVIFFGAYAPENFPNPLVYSLAYNGGYLAAEAAITIIILLLPPVKKAMATVRDIA